MEITAVQRCMHWGVNVIRQCFAIDLRSAWAVDGAHFSSVSEAGVSQVGFS